MNVSRKAVMAMLLPFFLFGGHFWGAHAATKSFAYADSQYVITAEVAGERSFVLNFINLSDFVIVVQPSEFIYRSASGHFYIGQVFEQQNKDNRGEVHRYSASVLIRSQSFTGLTVDGLFLEQDAIEELSIRIGAKRYYLEQLEKADFEKLAAKVGELDIESDNPKAALADANIDPLGRVKSTDGTSEWDRDWQGLIMSDGMNPPRIIESPPIAPTEEAVRTHTFGKVKLSATITKDGTIVDLQVVKGLGRGLDERALEGVKNSWKFLPATRNGEILQTFIKFDVTFSPPPPKP